MTAWLSLLALALGLAMDAFAAAVAQGATTRPDWKRSMTVAVVFGLAQGLMPLLGWSLGQAFASIIDAVDHWVALILLGGLGGRMIVAGWKGEPSEEGLPMSAAALLVAAIATSIDAAVAGITLPLIGLPLAVSIGVIGVVTFVLALVGMRGGRTLGTALGSKAEVLGGLVLVGVGLKIFITHQFLGG